MQLSESDVKSLDTNPTLFLYSEEFSTTSDKDNAFRKEKHIDPQKSNRRFEVVSAANGNNTLGHFDVHYKGMIKNCTFTGHYKITDTFKFNWDFSKGRSTHGEALVRIFSMQMDGFPFNVESEWISVTEKRRPK